MPNPRQLLLASAVAASSVVGAFAAETGPVIGKVEILGTERTHPDRIRARIGTRAGDRFDRDVLADDVRAIHSMEAFTGIRTEITPDDDGTLRITFHVSELPILGEIRFTGVPWYVSRSLDDEIRLKVGDYLNPLVLERDRRNLEDYFKAEQYLYATVEAITTVDPESGVGTVTFHIERGEKVKVARTLFEGLPDEVVELFLQQRLSNRPGAHFQPEMLRWDAGTVAEYLRSRGWLDAKVMMVRDEFYDSVESWEERFRHGPRLVPEGKRDDRVVVTFFVDAGPRYNLRSVRFINDTGIATETELREAFELADGVAYEEPEIGAAVDRVRRVIANKGYARVRVGRDAIQDTDAAEVDLTLRIVEGDVYVIGRVDPDGNTITKDQVIRRAMELEPGMTYSEDGVDGSVRQIRRAGIFKTAPGENVNIEKYYPDDRPGEVDLRVNVNEDDTGRFTFSAGWSSSSGFLGSVEYEERNFDLLGFVWDQSQYRGAGHTFSANASFSEDRTVFGVGFVNPRVFDSPYFLSLRYQRSENTSLDWDETRQQSNITIGRYFLDYDLLLSIGYGYTDLIVKNPQLDAANDTFIRIPAHYHVNTITLSQTYDVRDNPRRPSKGFRIAARQSFSGGLISASHPYMELVLEGDAHYPLYEADLGGRTVLSFRQRWAYLRGLTDDNYVPFYNRYYGGGPAPRHRGFDSFEQGPRVENAAGIEALPGGTREWLSTIEVSIPIQGTDSGIRGVVFTDIGQIWGADEGFSWGDLKVASGIGVRMPAFLPIAFDVAWLLNPETGQQTRQFHFSISGGF